MPVMDDHTGHDTDEPADTGTLGKTYHHGTAIGTPGKMNGTNFNDTFHVEINGRPSDQVHIYGNGGNDTLHLDMTLGPSRLVQHGHHLRLGDGDDRVIFADLNEMAGTVVGRFDDFNVGDDTIWIGNQKLDLNNPSAITGFNAKVVSYMGQQWLDISNDIGGRLFYALEGPRLVDGVEEAHFLHWNHKIPAVLPVVKYVDPSNEVPTDMVAQLGNNLVKSYPKGAVADGTAMNDLLVADSGHNLSHAGAGNDLVYGGVGNDTIYGDAGNDILDGGRGADSLRGGEGNDTLFGSTDNDILYGGVGDDHLSGGSENDDLYGEDGNDRLYGDTGNDRLYGGNGADDLFGGNGTDTLYGGMGNDTIHGNANSDLIDGGEGDDKIWGGSGNDTIYAQAGADTLAGETGHDTFIVKADNVFAYGGDGNDIFQLNGENIFAAGGEGNNLFEVGAGSTVTISDFDAAHDRLDIAEHFIDEEDMLDFVRARANADDPSITDLEIDLPDGGMIVLRGQGALASAPGGLVQGWGEDPDPEDPGFPTVPPDPDDEDDEDDDNDDDGGFNIGSLLGLGVLAALIGMGGIGF